MAGMAIGQRRCCHFGSKIFRAHLQPGVWWHMLLGRHILETGNLIIDHSIFTWTAATPHSTYNAWIAEILLYLVYSKTGSMGLIALRYGAYSGFFVLATYFAIQRGVATNPLAWIIIILGTVLSFAAMYVQPELFSFVFMFVLVWLYFFIRGIGVRAWALCYFFPLIIVLWVNAHGAFVLSALFFMAIGLGEICNVAFSSTKAMPTQLRIHLFLALALCLPALLVNPYGYALPLDLISGNFYSISELKMFSQTIMAYLPTFLANAPPDYALDYLLLAMVVYVFLLWQLLKTKQIDWVVIFAFLAYSFLFVQFGRATYPLAPVFVFSSLELLATKTGSWAWPRAKYSRIVIALFSAACICLIAWRVINTTICAGNLWTDPLIATMFPIEEADYIGQLPQVKKLGNTYDEGGYLLYRLWPATQVMIDSRYFPFKPWFEQYMRFENGQDIPKFISEHQADIWFVPHNKDSLMQWFSLNKAHAWTPVFFSPAGAVFAPITGAKQELKYSSNIEYIASFAALKYVFDSSIMLKNLALAARIQVHTAALAASRPSCNRYYILSHEMLEAVIGFRAFWSGDYATAAAHLSKGGYFIHPLDVAITALKLLAKHAWDSNDYASARMRAMGSVSLGSHRRS